ncbi:hypothetical protein SBY92_002485 [Candida maltosa Xu316]
MSTNPLRQILTETQFNQAVEFYDADQKLDHNERLTLAAQLQNIGWKTNLTGYTTGMLGFFAPTFYYRSKSVFPTPLFLIQRPFFSLILGFGTLLAGGGLMSKYLFNNAKKVDYADPNISNVWKTIDYPYLQFYTLYYTRTSLFPNFIMRDPRTCTYAASDSSHFTEAVGLGKLDDTGKSHELSIWDKVRLSHGGNIEEPLFKEADSQLTKEDRIQIRDDLKKLIVQDNFATYFAGILGALVPTIYIRFFNKRLLNPLAFVQKPGLSIATGIANGIITHKIYSKKIFNEQVNQDLPEAQSRVWRSIDPDYIGIYMLHYFRTTLPKPVQQPGDQHSGENGGGEHELSAWDKIRLANGLDVSQSNNQTTSPSTSSAWDELRKK